MIEISVSQFADYYHGLKRRLHAYATIVSRISLGQVLAFVLQHLPGEKTSSARVKKHPLHYAWKAVQLCRGTGIEVGSLHRRLPLMANVLYLDAHKTTSLLELYSKDQRVTEIGQVQLIASGGKYSFLDDGAFDFVASSHVLEHTCNPPRQIEEWLRIVRRGGIIYMIVPDKRFCFDRRREVTPLAHFVEEYDGDVSSTAIEHYRDFLVNTNGEDGLVRDISDESIGKYHATQSSIHVHTFTADSLREFLEHFAQSLAFEVIHFKAEKLHIHAALKKA